MAVDGCTRNMSKNIKEVRILIIKLYIYMQKCYKAIVLFKDVYLQFLYPGYSYPNAPLLFPASHLPVGLIFVTWL